MEVQTVRAAPDANESADYPQRDIRIAIGD
jgi:hypothetical protein